MAKTRTCWLRMDDLGSYEALLAGDKPSGRIRWPKGQLLEKYTRVTAHESSVAKVLASGG